MRGVFQMKFKAKTHFRARELGPTDTKEYVFVPAAVQSLQRVDFRPIQTTRSSLSSSAVDSKKGVDKNREQEDRHAAMMRKPGFVQLVVERRFQTAVTQQMIWIDPARMSRNYVSRLVRMGILGFRLGLLHLSPDRHLRVLHHLNLELSCIHSPVYELLGITSGELVLFGWHNFLDHDELTYILSGMGRNTHVAENEYVGKTMESVLT